MPEAYNLKIYIQQNSWGDWYAEATLNHRCIYESPFCATPEEALTLAFCEMLNKDTHHGKAELNNVQALFPKPTA